MPVLALLPLTALPAAPRRRPALPPAPAVAAPAARPRPPADDDSLLGALGGEPGIRAIVEALIAAVAADPRINRQFAGANPARLRRLLVAQFTVLSLGPVRVDDPLLDLDLAYAHHSDRLERATVQAVIEHLEAVLDARRLPLGQQGRLLSRFATAFATPRARAARLSAR